VLADNSSVAWGGRGSDELKAEIGSPRLLGGQGDDHVQVGLSLPDVNGGPGTDSIAFWFGDQPVRVNLARKTAWSPKAGSMPLVNVENVDGTAYADVIRGNVAPNVLTGGDGNDRIYGRGGRDKADGGTGHDSCVAEVQIRC